MLAKFRNSVALVALLIGAFFLGNYYGVRGYEVQVRKHAPLVKIHNKQPYSNEIDFSLFWDVWDEVRSRHLDRPFDPQQMMYGAIAGMVASIGDPYTSFLTPEENQMMTNTLNGQYEGIGAELALKDGQLIIVAPLDGSPAKSAGIKPGDVVLQIAGDSTTGISLMEAVSRIRGPAGTTITLTIQRPDEAPQDISITRGRITVASVTWSDKGDGVAYVRISRFGAETTREWSKVVSQINLKMADLDAIILDLRGNPGGFMDAAIYIASEFLENDAVVMYQEDALGNDIVYKDTRTGSFERIPRVVVLMDGGSASASEILASALKENLPERVTLLGTKSFGKGTIQDAQDLPDGSGLHVTIAKWLTPKKNWVHNVGLKPDVDVAMSVDSPSGDVQLDAAMDLVHASQPVLAD